MFGVVGLIAGCCVFVLVLAGGGWVLCGLLGIVDVFCGVAGV